MTVEEGKEEERQDLPANSLMVSPSLQTEDWTNLCDIIHFLKEYILLWARVEAGLKPLHKEECICGSCPVQPWKLPSSLSLVPILKMI